MAKTATEGTISPNLFAPNAEIILEQAEQVIETQNLVAGQRAPVLLAFRGDAIDTPGGPTNIVTHGQSLPASWTVLYQGQIYIPKDAQQLTLTGGIEFDSSPESADVRFNIGSSFLTLGVDDVTPETSGSLSTASTGLGWQDVTIDFQRTSGAGIDGIGLLQIQVTPIAAGDLPDP